MALQSLFTGGKKSAWLKQGNTNTVFSLNLGHRHPFPKTETLRSKQEILWETPWMIRRATPLTQAAAVTSGINIPPLQSVSPWKKTTQVFNQTNIGKAPTPLHSVVQSTCRDWFSFEICGFKESPFDTLKAIRMWRNLTHKYTFSFKHNGCGEGWLVCFQNVAIFIVVVAFIHDMRHAWNAQQRHLNASTSHVCCLRSHIPGEENHAERSAAQPDSGRNRAARA